MDIEIAPLHRLGGLDCPNNPLSKGNTRESMGSKAVVQVVLMALSIALLLYFVEIGEIVVLMGNISLQMIILLLVITLFRPVVSGYRCVLAHSEVKRITLKDATAGYYFSAFASTLLPSTIGGDIIRIEHMSRATGNSRSDSLGIAAAERISGLLSLIIIFLILSAIIPNSLGYDSEVLLIGIFIIIFLVILFLIMKQSSNRLPRWLQDALNSVMSIGSKGVIIKVLLVSLLFQAVGILIPMLVTMELGNQQDILAIALITPLTWLVTTVPTTIGGIGVREASFVGFGAMMGVNPEIALLCGLSVSASMIVTGLFGILLSGQLTMASDESE